MRSLTAKPSIAIGCVAVILVLGGLYRHLGHPEPPTSSANSDTSAHRTDPTSSAPIAHSQYTVLLDVSASRPPAMIAEGERFMDTIIDHMSFGDRLLVLEIYEKGVNEAKGDLDLLLIQPGESLSLDEGEELKTARNALKEPVHLFFQRAQTRPVLHTDILTTLSIASEKIAEGKRNQLIVLSDMLQSSKEFEFEHLLHMPPPDWITRRKQQGLMRPLYGACVIAIGADPSTREGVVIRQFWQKYFEASNATLNEKNYRTTPPSGDSSWCD
ncbi:MAG TPA: hypothetical protein VKZ53_18780 [Candidatus Angelobacter sp.]|nr:hypothetical protein [Candidatus Angelobacter sp.]